MWKELWKSLEIQWLPLKYFLTHHLELDYEVNRLEFAPVMLFYFLSHWFQVPSKHVSVFSSNDKCSLGKRCHKKHIKYFSDKKKKRTSTPHWALFQMRNYARWEAENKSLAALLRLWLTETCRGLEIWLFQWTSDGTREGFLRKRTLEYDWVLVVHGPVKYLARSKISCVHYQCYTGKQPYSGQRHLFKNLLGTENELKLPFFLGEGNGQ